MRLMDPILNDIAAYLIERKKYPDADYFARQAHFTVLNQLWEKQEYTKLLDHLAAGIQKFTKKSFFKQRYYHFLLEIHTFFYINDKEQQKIQLEKLSLALENNHPDQVNMALREGALGAINASKQLNENLLTMIKLALERKHYLSLITLLKNCDLINLNELCFSLKKYYKSNDIIINENNGYSLLHFACEYGYLKLVKELIAFGVDINIKTKEGRTPLYLACNNYNRDDIINFLLEQSADPNITICTGNENLSCLDLVVLNNNYRQALKFLQKGVDIDANAHRIAKKIYGKNYKTKQIYKILKQPFRERKEGILKKGPISQHVSTSFFVMLPPAIRVIAAHLYLEEPTKAEFVLQQLIAWYTDKNEILKPLIDMVAFVNSNDNNNPSIKKIKTIVYDGDDLSDVLPGGKNAKGAYTCKNSVFVSLKYFHSTIPHEWKHAIDFLLSHHIENLNKPDYRTQKIIQNKIAFLPNRTEEDLLTKELFFLSKNYAPTEYVCEYLARVPELLTLMNIEKGYQWLTQNLPELLELYQHFNLVCLNFLELQQKQNRMSDVSNVAIFFRQSFSNRLFQNDSILDDENLNTKKI